MLVNCLPLVVKLLYFACFEANFLRVSFILPALLVIDKSVLSACEHSIVATLEVSVLGVIFLGPNLILDPLIPRSVSHFVILSLEVIPGCSCALESPSKCRCRDRISTQGVLYLGD